jgi:hypothetical protein
LVSSGFIFLLISSNQLFLGNQIFVDTTSYSAGNSYRDYALSLLSTLDRVNLSTLRLLSGGQMSVNSFERIIQLDFLPFNIRRILLDIGWQNYSVGSIPYEPWVGNWLSACDQMGIQNVFYLGQFTRSGINSVWIQSLISTDSSTQTYYSNGQPAEYVSMDNPDVAKAVETDVSLLYSYYGSHPSWIGFGTGFPQNDPYYTNNSTMPIFGYSNSSVVDFVNSIFFARDVNQTGFLPNGGIDELWSSFKNFNPPIELSSGNWMLSSPDDVYGSGTSQYSVAMSFYIPSYEHQLQLEWYGNKIGNPNNLNLTIFSAGTNGSFSTNHVVASQTQSSILVGVVTGWQPPVELEGDFLPGYYWIVLSSPSSNASDFYQIYMRDYELPNASAEYLMPPGLGTISGSSILQIRDGTGATIEVYPYENAIVGPQSQQTFVASSSFSFNTIFLFVSDREFDPTNGTIQVMDLSTNQVLGQGILSQSLTRGLQNWVPFSLDQNITTIVGHVYKISVFEPNNGYSWRVILRGLSVSPSTAGFQNQSQFLLFRLASVKWSQSYEDFGGMTSNGRDAVTNGYLDAVRFSPLTNETLQSIAILMKNLQPTGSYYSNGDLTIEVRASDSSGLSPLPYSLQSKIVPASNVPQNGWLNVTGYDLKVTANNFYWVVFSTNSNSAFSLARLTSPYQFLVKVSSDNGSTWTDPTEGPTEFSFEVILSNEIVGNLINAIPSVYLNQTSEIAQPFAVQSATQVFGVYIGGGGIGVKQELEPNSYLLVSINPDNGEGEPSDVMLGYGAYSSSNVTYVSPDLVQFSSLARLEQGKRYWIVIRAVGAIDYVNPVQYLMPPKGVFPNESALVSNDNGFTWTQTSNLTTILSYKIASPVTPLPTLNTTQIYQDLSMYHDFPTQSGELKGWNAFIQSSELETFDDMIKWFNNYTDKKWAFFTTSQPNVLNGLSISNIQLLPQANSFSNCSSLSRYLLTRMPIEGFQYFDVANASLLASCSALNARLIGQDLNLMLYVGNPENTSSNGQVDYSISGGKGDPLLIWFSNPMATATEYTFHLDGASYSLPTSWKIIDLTSLQTTIGVGSEVAINVAIQPSSFDPIYVVPKHPNLMVEYSNAAVNDESTYSNQGLYRISGEKNQSILLVISSNAQVQAISLNDNGYIAQMSSRSLFLTSQQGWYFDQNSSTLFVKYMSTGFDLLRVFQGSIPVHSSSIATILFLALVTTLIAEGGLVFYFKGTTKKR